SVPPACLPLLLQPPRHPRPTLFPYTTLFRSRSDPARRRARTPGGGRVRAWPARDDLAPGRAVLPDRCGGRAGRTGPAAAHAEPRSEEHTSEPQSRENLVCRLLLEKKNNDLTR